VRTLIAFLILVTSLGAQPDRFGLPACEEISDRSFYLLCYDQGRKVAAWTAHELTPGKRDGPAGRPTHFRRDANLSGEQASNADYRGSGYSRGHLVPAEDMSWSDAAIRSTFVLTMWFHN
jgi:DNA/RNA endonuclease G (NUC1)